MESLSKKEIRKQIKNKLDILTSKEITIQSEIVSKLFIDCDIYKNSQLLLSYMAMKKELNPISLTNKALSDGKEIAIPKCIGTRQMEFYFLDCNKEIFSQVETGNYGIFEPLEKNQHFDLLDKNMLNSYKNKRITIVVPCVAYTKDGKRLGHGGGYYDIYLSRILQIFNNVTTVGICLNEQIVEDLPVEKNDIKMDYIITASEIIKC